MRIMGLDEVRRPFFRAANTNLPAGPDKLTWRISQRGNPFAIVDGFHAVVYRRQTGQWTFRIEQIESGETWYSECRYSTERAARTGAFREVERILGEDRDIVRAVTP